MHVSLMTDSGIAAVNLAKISGTWDNLNNVDSLIYPEDLVAEFKKYSNAEKISIYSPNQPDAASLSGFSMPKSLKQEKIAFKKQLV